MNDSHLFEGNDHILNIYNNQEGGKKRRTKRRKTKRHRTKGHFRVKIKFIKV
jgi:hypothetical protein